jgi:hypothetical protein
MIALLVIKIMLAVTLLVTAVDSADTTWNQPLEFKSRHLSLEDCQMSQQYKQNSVCTSTGELYGIR